MSAGFALPQNGSNQRMACGRACGGTSCLRWCSDPAHASSSAATPRVHAQAAGSIANATKHEPISSEYDTIIRSDRVAMSVNVDTASGIAEMRLIDPPRVLPRPVTPSRQVLLPLVLCAALAAGLAAAFIASQLQPLCHRAADLREHFDVPLLGVVSLVETSELTTRLRPALGRFALASGGLVALFVLALITLGATERL